MDQAVLSADAVLRAVDLPLPHPGPVFRSTQEIALWLTIDVDHLHRPVLLGNAIFSVLHNAGRVPHGAGAPLFLCSGLEGRENPLQREEPGSFIVVPLAIPITVGPATTGALLVMGAEVTTPGRNCGRAALVGAVPCGHSACPGDHRRENHRPDRPSYPSKITGLVLSALASQMVFVGARNFRPEKGHAHAMALHRARPRGHCTP